MTWSGPSYCTNRRWTDSGFNRPRAKEEITGSILSIDCRKLELNFVIQSIISLQLSEEPAATCQLRFHIVQDFKESMTTWNLLIIFSPTNKDISSVSLTSHKQLRQQLNQCVAINMINSPKNSTPNELQEKLPAIKGKPKI